MDKIPTVLQKSLDVLVAKFGTTGTVLWHAVLSYTRMYALGCLLSGLLFCTLTAIIVWRIPVTDPDCEAKEFIKTIVYVLLTAIASIFIGANLPTIINPLGAVTIHLLTGSG